MEGCVCPVCGKGRVLESARSFFCSELSGGCHFTLWKDTLSHSGAGPELNAAIVRLLLTQKQVRGSTGTITLGERTVAFWPIGAQRAAVERPIIYEKK